MRVQRREDMVTHFIQLYHDIQNNEVHNDLQNDLIKLWKWNSQQSHKNKVYVNLYVKLYLIDILFFVL
jgi:hypothetical protein